MNCIGCGTAVEGTRRFCSECNGSSGDTALGANSHTQSKPPRVLWLVLVVIAMIGTYAAVLMPALTGSRSDATGMLGCVFWTGLFFFLIWKRSERTPWIGAAIGAVLGLAFVFITDVLALRSTSLELDGVVFSAVDAFDPAAGAALRQIRSNEALVKQQLQPLLALAVQTASDDAVLEFSDAQRALFEPSTPAGLNRCAAAASGRAAASSSALSRSETEKIAAAMAKLFHSASRNRTAATIDIARLQEIVQPIYASADPTNVLQDPAQFRSLPEPQQCAIYLRLRDGIRALPEAAMAFRHIMSSQSAAN